MTAQTPDAIIAPWLDDAPGNQLWVIGDAVPPVVQDYIEARDSEVFEFDATIAAIDWSRAAQACLITQPIQNEVDLLLLGRLRNHLIPHILCFANTELDETALFALSFKRGAAVVIQGRTHLSFSYALATYNHSRAWNNPKFWANPENWNKYWW